MSERTGVYGYSDDLRRRIVRAIEAGETLNAVAQTYEVTVATVTTYVRKQAAGTLFTRIKPVGRRPTVQAEYEAVLLESVEKRPDATLQEHADELFQRTALRITYRTVDRLLTKHQITYKKNAGRVRAP